MSLVVDPTGILGGWLKQRECDGLDHRDEMWNGVLHLVPAPKSEHGDIQAWLFEYLVSRAQAQGLSLRFERGVYAGDDDYRVPDLVAASSDRRSERGFEVPVELVIEILSPGDETMDKIPWYSEHGIGELLVIHRDTKLVRRWTYGPTGLVEHRPRFHFEEMSWHELRSIPGVRIGGTGDGRLQFHSPIRNLVFGEAT